MKKVSAYKCLKCDKLFHTEDEALYHEARCSYIVYGCLSVSKESGGDWEACDNKYSSTAEPNKQLWGKIGVGWTDSRIYVDANFGIAFKCDTPIEEVKKELIEYATPRIKAYMSKDALQSFVKTVNDWQYKDVKED